MTMMRLFEKTATTTADIDGTVEIELDMETGGYSASVEIVRVTAQHLAGSAATFQVSIGNITGFVAGSINQKYLSGVTAVANTLDESDTSAYCVTSTSGKLFLKFLTSAGSDNQFAYSIMYKR